MQPPRSRRPAHGKSRSNRESGIRRRLMEFRFMTAPRGILTGLMDNVPTAFIDLGFGRMFTACDTATDGTARLSGFSARTTLHTVKP